MRDSEMFDRPFSSLLSDVASPAQAPASGAACALALALAVECLALQEALWERRGRSYGDGSGWDLSDRLAEWRETARACLRADADAVEAIVRARRGRDAAAAEERGSWVEVERRALAQGNRSLVRLGRAAEDVRRAARRTLAGREPEPGGSEARTAVHLAEAVVAGVSVMLAENLRTAARRPGALEGLSEVEAFAAELESEDASALLSLALRELAREVRD